jgi:hypothetical protein
MTSPPVSFHLSQFGAKRAREPKARAALKKNVWRSACRRVMAWKGEDMAGGENVVGKIGRGDHLQGRLFALADFQQNLSDLPAQ